MADFHETPDMYPNLNVALNDQQHFRRNKINGFRDYFVAETKERELTSKLVNIKLSKYTASFDDFDKLLLSNL